VRALYSAAMREPTSRLVRRATIAAAFIIAQQTAGKATRDALFLLAHDVGDLPRIMIMAAVTCMAAVPLLTRYMLLFGPRATVPGLFVVSVGGFAIEYMLAGFAPKTAASLLFLHQSVLGAILVSGFWSLTNERFDVSTMRTAAPRIATGATAGGFAGGLLAERLSTVVTPITMLPVLAGIHLLGLVLVLSLRTEPRHDDTLHQPNTAEVLRESPYLRHIGLLLLTITIGTGVIDFAFKEAAAHRYEGGALLRFFAVFYTASSAATFVVQAFVSRFLPRSIGPARTVMSMPLTLGIGAIGILLAPGLVSRTLAIGLARVVQSSVFRFGYETLYTPVPVQERRAAKTANDVSFDRLGDLVAGLIVQGIRSVPAVSPTMALAAGVLAVAFAAGWLVRRLAREYLDSLELQVVDAALHAADGPWTGPAVLGTTYGAEVQPDLPSAELGSTAAGSEAIDPVIERIRALRGTDVTAIRQVLEGELGPAEAPHVIRLLGRGDLYHEVLASLRRIAPTIIGQLLDAMLDGSQSSRIRRRIPRALVDLDDERVFVGLSIGLRDFEFEVRRQCAHALVAIHERAPSLPIPHATVHAALEVESRTLSIRSPSRRASAVGSASGDGDEQRLDYVFALLSLLHPSDAMQSALVGLRSDDPKRHGAAVEYLENLLPPSLRASLLGAG